jgi:hypothetical protein
MGLGAYPNISLKVAFQWNGAPLRAGRNFCFEIFLVAGFNSDARL